MSGIPKTLPPMPPEAPPDPTLSPEARADIQGFITSGYKHLPESAFYFLHFGDAAGARAWLGLALADVTFAESWRRAPGQAKERPEVAVNVAISKTGLETLGLPRDCLDTFPSEFLEGAGSNSRSDLQLGDTGTSAPETWQIGGPGTPSVDAVLILHAKTAGSLERLRSLWEERIGSCHGTGILARELGSRPPENKEHFGFRDGISQPQIKGVQRGGSGLNTGEFILGYVNEYGYHTVNPLVSAADDPDGLLPDSANPIHAGRRDFGMNGTFVVYRKLAQHVATFWRFMEAESIRRLGVADPMFMVRLASKLVGRWPSGAPLTLAPESDNPTLSNANDFTFAKADPVGRGCPFGSHIRRTGPRDMIRPAGPSESLRMSARHQILRRGKPYGPPLFDLRVLDRIDDLQGLRAILGLCDDGKDRGLHFFCINASIRSQFEFMQQVWANNPRFNGLSGSRDPLIGDNGHPNDPSALHIPGNNHDWRTAPLPRFVTVRGGAYLFMPGKRAMTFLARRRT